MSDEFDRTAHISDLVARNDAAMRSDLARYQAGALPTAQLLEAFIAHSQAQADYKSTILTLMLANGCSKEEIGAFITNCLGLEWPDVLPDE